MPFSPAQRRYNRRILWLSLLYAGLLFLAVYLLSRQLVSGPAAIVIGVMPALAVSSFFWAMGVYLVEERDEYLRMLMIRQLLIATGVMLTGASIWGFLEGFALVPHIIGYWWVVVWLGALGLGACLNRIIERRAG